jgi:formate dehydrogenase (hydrogenase)
MVALLGFRSDSRYNDTIHDAEPFRLTEFIRNPFSFKTPARPLQRFLCTPPGRGRVQKSLFARNRTIHGIGPLNMTQQKSLISKRSRGRKSSSLTRITTPLVRDNGVLREASWEEAMSRAAAGFLATKADHGKNAIGVFSCSKSTNEMNYIAQKWIRAVIGSNNIDSCNRT